MSLRQGCRIYLPFIASFVFLMNSHFCNQILLLLFSGKRKLQFSEFGYLLYTYLIKVNELYSILKSFTILKMFVTFKNVNLNNVEKIEN